MLDPKYGYLHSCPTNLGTGMRASVHVDLPGWTKEGLPAPKARCEELHLQPRGTRGESGGQTGITYDISNKHRLGYTEVGTGQLSLVEPTRGISCLLLFLYTLSLRGFHSRK